MASQAWLRYIDSRRSRKDEFAFVRNRQPERIEADEIPGWAAELEVPDERLREAIRRVGPMVEDVREFLENPTR